MAKGRWRGGAGALAATLVALASLGCVAACSGSSGTHRSPKNSSASQTAQALQLVGLWDLTSVRLSGGPGDAPQVVRFGGEGDLTIVRRCGVLRGRWAATNDGALITVVDPGRACKAAGQPPWIQFAWRYRLSGDALTVINSQGGTQASLVRSKGHQDAANGLATQSGSTPSPSASLQRRLLAGPPSLPTGTRPVTAPDQIGGVWDPSGSSGGQGIQFLSNSYSLERDSDCALGAFAYGSLGMVAWLPADPACHPAGVVDWLSRAARIGIDGGKLALIDSSGHMLGELQRRA